MSQVVERARVELALPAVFVFAVCLGTGCAEGPRSKEPKPVEAPAGAGSLAPDLSPGLDGRLRLTWIEPSDRGHRLRFSTWNGSSWGEPLTVAEGDDWFVNWADFPSMAALADGTLAAHWLARSGAATYAYDVRISASRDAGRHWSRSIVPHGDGTQTEHGFVSWVPRDDGRFDLLWLDGRRTAAGHEGTMTLRHGTWDPSGQRVRETEIDDRVCDCCSTDAVRMPDGALLVAYRDRSGTETRDIAVSRNDGAGWSPPVRVHADGWTIAACPVNGPALASEGDRVAVAWYTGADDEARVLVAFSDDGGRSFGAPVRIDLGDPLGRVDLVLLPDGTGRVVWVERIDGGAQILLRPASPEGTGATTRIAETSPSRASGFPRMARAGDRLVLAWTEVGDPSSVRTATLAW